MVILHLFIEHHYKYIVSIIRERHVLTLHLSTANWRIKLTTGCCCKNVAAHYAIYFCLVESIPQFLELWPISMHFHGTSNFTLLYRNATTYGIINIVLPLQFQWDLILFLWMYSMEVPRRITGLLLMVRRYVPVDKWRDFLHCSWTGFWKLHWIKSNWFWPWVLFFSMNSHFVNWFIHFLSVVASLKRGHGMWRILFNKL